MIKAGQEHLIILRTYYDPILAHIERTRLEDNGIPCTIDDSMANTYPIYSSGMVGVKLMIFERDKERAEAILAEQVSLPVEEVPDGAIAGFCPYCGSANILYALSVTDDANWFTRTLSALFGWLPFEKDADWHCFNCGRDFEEPLNADK